MKTNKRILKEDIVMVMIGFAMIIVGAFIMLSGAKGGGDSK